MALPLARRSTSSMKPGDLVGGRYELIEPIGSGAFGTVFLARHTRTLREVALKVLHDHFVVDEATRARFQRETQAPAVIAHPGIVEVLDADVTESGIPWFAMERLKGETLRERCLRSMPNIGEILEMFEELLEALAAAHEKGYVHRDLKPDNTFLSHEGDGSVRLRLLDFGLTRRSHDESVTDTGASLGTPRYMSPEQFMSAKHVTPAADCWAVGVMLYELLSGRSPFSETESQHALMLQILTVDHHPLALVAPDVPAPLVGLVERCLKKEPSERTANAALLLAELRFVRSALSVDAARTVPEMPAMPAVPRTKGAPTHPSPTMSGPEGGMPTINNLWSPTHPRPPPAMPQKARGRPWLWLGAAFFIAVLFLTIVAGFLVLIAQSVPGPPPPEPAPAPVVDPIRPPLLDSPILENPPIFPIPRVPAPLR